MKPLLKPSESSTIDAFSWTMGFVEERANGGFVLGFDSPLGIAGTHLSEPVGGHAHSFAPAVVTHGQSPIRGHLLHHASAYIVPPAAAAPPESTLTQAQVDVLKAGFNQTLASIDSNVAAQVFAESLPIVGNNLGDAATAGATQVHFIGNLKTAIVGGLNSLSGSATYTAAQVEGAINGSLASAGIGGLGATVDFSNASDIVLHLVTNAGYGALTTPIEGDLSLPNLGLRTTGNAQTTLAHQFNFTAGLDGAGFYVATAPGMTFKVTTDTKLPGFTGTADIASLRLHAEDHAAQPTDFVGEFQLTLKDPGSDGRLRIGELGGDLVDATFSGNGGLRLDLDSILPASAAMPQFGTDLGITWAFANAVVNPADNNTTFGSAPDVRFNNNTLNLGSFFGSFAGRALNEITRVTGPLKPVIDVLTTPIPILSDLGSTKVTLLDFAGLQPAQTAAIKGLADILDLSNKVATFTNDGMVQIDLGSLTVGGDLRTDLPANLGLTIVRQAALPAAQNPHAAEFVNGVNTIGGGGLSFPVLTNFKSIGDLLLGHNVDLFDYKKGFGFDTEFSQYWS